ncbi:glycosyltransferase [Chryseobacterium indoltheticum]|uniref:Vi polysaccharide biosynthesis protein TviE n=1 Tax=Chryseobacterium indoltheticum TaxID=254 RepID=A0A381FPC6_9FLAO|nr:glycosyltransferase [Chryseobacterium indoltheticum]SUX48411.1 Vi polysaccharide biosynthesis protein TviE [Chryseobacterium indoltheticum]
MKILFVITSLNAGGIENYLLRFLHHYESAFYPVVLCKSAHFGDLEKEYSSIQNIRLLKIKLGYFNFNAYRNFQTFLEKENFDAVCDFTGNFAGLVMKTAFNAGIQKRVTFYRGSTNRFSENTLKKLYNNWVNNLVLRYSTSILSNSEAAFTYFFKKKDERFHVIYNGLDSSKFKLSISQEQVRLQLNIPTKAFVIGHTGRVHFSKNHETIIEVAAILCEKYSDIYFVLVGKNTDQAFNKLLKDKNLTKRFILLGYQENIPLILKSFDFYFFPSVTEGQPNSLIEAMVSGLPFVASDIAPIKETVPRSKQEVLFDPKNIAAFATKIEDYYLKKWKHDPEITLEVQKKFDADEKFKEFFEILKY